VTVTMLSTGTATAGSDYTAWSPLSRTLTFAPGVTSQSVTVSVTGDRTREPDETVHLRLSAPSGADLGTTLGVVTIRDDDSRLLAAAAGPGAAPTTQVQVDAVLRDAIARWVAAGADPALLARVRVVLVDLPGADDLAQAVGTTIRLDADAAGWGWSADAEPGRMDLLSALVHELAHVLGIEHDERGLAALLLPGRRDLAVLAAAPATRPAAAPAAASRPRGAALAEPLALLPRAEEVTLAGASADDRSAATVTPAGGSVPAGPSRSPVPLLLVLVALALGMARASHRPRLA
jgi:hypothetical protein